MEAILKDVRVYRELGALISNFFDPTIFLPELEIHNVISRRERSVIECQSNPIDQIKYLCVNIMPSKDRTCHQKLAQILLDSRHSALADYLVKNLTVLSNTIIEENVVKNSTSLCQSVVEAVPIPTFVDPERLEKAAELENSFIKAMDHLDARESETGVVLVDAFKELLKLKPDVDTQKPMTPQQKFTL